jgi:hypothetical protein
MTTTKRCLQYVHQGVWLGFNKPCPLLPRTITSLYEDWESSTNRTWEIFKKYLKTFNSVSLEHPDTDNDYIFKASLNGSKDKMKEYAAKQLRTKVLEQEQVTPKHVLQVFARHAGTVEVSGCLGIHDTNASDGSNGQIVSRCIPQPS